jgi:hypothetical protein
MNDDTPPSQRLVKCTRCGWLHIALTADEVAQHAATPELQASYRKCSNKSCTAPASTFVPASDDDAPALAQLPTIRGCIVAEQPQECASRCDGTER